MLSFQVKFGNKNLDEKFSMGFTFQSDGDQLKVDLSLVLEVKKSEAKLSFQFEPRMRWKDGGLIKNKPKAVAA